MALPTKKYDALNWTVQFRKLRMISDKPGITRVFTISSDVKEG